MKYSPNHNPVYVAVYVKVLEGCERAVKQGALWQGEVTDIQNDLHRQVWWNVGWFLHHDVYRVRRR